MCVYECVCMWMLQPKPKKNPCTAVSVPEFSGAVGGGGGNSKGEGANPLFYQICPENYIKMKEIGPGTRVPGTPLDPLLCREAGVALQYAHIMLTVLNDKSGKVSHFRLRYLEVELYLILFCNPGHEFACTIQTVFLTCSKWLLINFSVFETSNWSIRNWKWKFELVGQMPNNID